MNYFSRYYVFNMDLCNESIRNVLGRLDPRFFLQMYPHSSAPCHNLHRSAFDNAGYNFLTKVSNNLSYRVSYPLPYSKPHELKRQGIIR